MLAGLRNDQGTGISFSPELPVVLVPEIPLLADVSEVGLPGVVEGEVELLVAALPLEL